MTCSLQMHMACRPDLVTKGKGCLGFESPFEDLGHDLLDMLGMQAFQSNLAICMLGGTKCSRCIVTPNNSHTPRASFEKLMWVGGVRVRRCWT